MTTSLADPAVLEFTGYQTWDCTGPKNGPPGSTTTKVTQGGCVDVDSFSSFQLNVVKPCADGIPDVGVYDGKKCQGQSESHTPYYQPPGHCYFFDYGKVLSVSFGCWHSNGMELK